MSWVEVQRVRQFYQGCHAAFRFPWSIILWFPLFSTTLNLSKPVVFRGTGFFWWDLLPLVYPMRHALISCFFFSCLWCVKNFMRFFCRCFERPLHWTHTHANDAAMSRYSALPFLYLCPNIGCHSLRSGIRDIRSMWSSAQHISFWVTVTGLGRLQRPCGFSQCSNVMLLMYVCVTGESHQIFWPHRRSQRRLVKPELTSVTALKHSFFSGEEIVVIFWWITATEDVCSLV